MSFPTTTLQPSPITLYSQVFQQNRCSEPNLTPELEAAKNHFLSLAHRIVEAEVQEGLRGNDADFEEQFR